MSANDSVTRIELSDKTSALHMLTNRPELSVPILCLCVLIIIFIIFCLIRIIRNKREKRPHSEPLTTRASSSQLYAGVRATQTIEFVVPTITLRATEPSFSLTEESDSDFVQMGYSSDSRLDYGSWSRKRNSRTQISESEISLSLYAEAPPKLDVQPEVVFVLHYSISRQQLLVTLLSARNLSSKRNTLSPFAKVVLLPEKNQKFVTKVQKNTKNPIFNELFVFQAMRDSIDNRILKITLYSTDSFSRKTVIGRTLFPLKTADITSKASADVVTDDISCLLIRSQPSGELLLSLIYDTSSSSLTLATLKARNIFDNEVQQIYLKIILFVKRKRIRSRKTTLREVESEITFDDKFQINVEKESINDISFSICIYGKSSAFTNKHILGRTQVGQTCASAQGRQHWSRMLNSMDTAITQWHIFS